MIGSHSMETVLRRLVKMKINNCRELWNAIMGTSVTSYLEEEAQAAVEKSVFRYTKCGCVFGADENGVYLAGYAEGSDAELPGHTLNWGFTLEEYNAVLDQADAEGVEEWELANELDLARVVDEDDKDQFLGGQG